MHLHADPLYATGQVFGACDQLVMKLAWRRPAGKKQWLLRQWKGKRDKISPWEELHGYYEEYMGVGNDVWGDMIWGVDQGNCILSVWFLPIGPSHDFCQSVIPRWEDSAPKHTAQLGYTTLHQASSPWWNSKPKSTQDKKSSLKSTC